MTNPCAGCDATDPATCATNCPDAQAAAAVVSSSPATPAWEVGVVPEGVVSYSAPPATPEGEEGVLVAPDGCRFDRVTGNIISGVHLQPDGVIHPDREQGRSRESDLSRPPASPAETREGQAMTERQWAVKSDGAIEVMPDQATAMETVDKCNAVGIEARLVGRVCGPWLYYERTDAASPAVSLPGERPESWTGEPHDVLYPEHCGQCWDRTIGGQRAKDARWAPSIPGEQPGGQER